MKRLAVFVVAVGVVLCAGCASNRTLTESEFKGFCYNAGGLSQPDCDTISLCDEYLPVFNQPQGSLGQCRAECQSIYAGQARRHILTECLKSAAYARGWCQKYCSGAYQQ
jgi:hypothetical protein